MRRLTVFARDKIELFERLLFVRDKKGVTYEHRFFFGELDLNILFDRQKTHIRLRKNNRNAISRRRKNISVVFILRRRKSVGSSLNLAGTKTLRANVNVLDRAVNNSLYASDIRFPHFIRASVGVGNFDPEADAFSANITLCHVQNTSIKYYTGLSL